MATPKPGEIRCPTCHRSTPPAAFCTQCGSAIPADARIRPRGMDRDELQDRIRARRSGGDPYRRGGPVDDEAGFERYEPEPEDAGAAARRRTEHDRRRDYLREETERTEPAPVTRDRDDWAAAPPSPHPPQAEPTITDEPEPFEVGEEPEYVDNFDDEAYGDGYQYEYEEWDDGRERRTSGAGAFAILGFLALGVLALLGGALLAGLFSGDGVGQNEASPTPIVTVAPSPSETAPASAEASASANASASAPASGEPTVFPDGFTAEAQPCLPGTADLDGCDSNGSVNSGATDIWIGFSGGSADDVIGARLLDAGGNPLGDGAIELADIGCTQDCQGYTRFNFSNLGVGEYSVEVTRNGQPADTVSFTVE